jgi:hypothetical protein
VVDKVVCGKCALKNYMDLSERKGLAMALEHYTVYRCSDCGIYLYFDGFRWQKSFDFLIIQSYADYDLKKLFGSDYLV